MAVLKKILHPDYAVHYRFLNFKQWRHVLELLLTCNILAFILAIAQVSNTAQLSLLNLMSHLLFVNWVAICFAACVEKIQKKIAQFSKYTGFALYFLILILIVFLSTCLVNFLQHMVTHPKVTITMQILLQDSLRHILLGGGLGILCMRYLYIKEQSLERQHAELMARIQALQARIHPHFLFNSLNSVVSLIAIDPCKAEQLLIDLSSLFRASLTELKEVSLDEEIALCHRYLKLESVRLGERLDVKWRIEDNSDLKRAKIPLLTLQPLLENCIYHGVESMSFKSVITILIEVVDKQVSLVLTNPYQQQGQSIQGNGIALENVKQRLHAYYGTSVRFNRVANNGLYTTIVSYKYQ